MSNLTGPETHTHREEKREITNSKSSVKKQNIMSLNDMGFLVTCDWVLWFIQWFYSLIKEIAVGRKCESELIMLRKKKDWNRVVLCYGSVACLPISKYIKQGIALRVSNRFFVNLKCERIYLAQDSTSMSVF